MPRSKGVPQSPTTRMHATMTPWMVRLLSIHQTQKYSDDEAQWCGMLRRANGGGGEVGKEPHSHSSFSTTKGQNLSQASVHDLETLDTRAS